MINNLPAVNSLGSHPPCSQLLPFHSWFIPLFPLTKHIYFSCSCFEQCVVRRRWIVRNTMTPCDDRECGSAARRVVCARAFDRSRLACLRRIINKATTGLHLSAFLKLRAYTAVSIHSWVLLVLEGGILNKFYNQSIRTIAWIFVLFENACM